jgi:hypothetical protein
MKRLITVVTACAVVVLMSGCAGIMSGTGGSTIGYIYSQVDGAVQHGAPVGETTSMSKVGTATSTAIICFASGDSSIKAAMENGGITKIHHVDYKVMNVLGGCYVKYTTVVYGE